MTRVNLSPYPPNEFKTYEKALVFIQRDSKNKVVDRSIQKFTSRREYKAFLSYVEKYLNKTEGLEAHPCHLRDAHPPEGKPQKISQAWCPYCVGWRSYFSLHGYKHCEICLRTTADFYWKKYNQRSPITIPTGNPNNKVPTSDEEKREKRRLRREKRKKERMKK